MNLGLFTYLGLNPVQLPQDYLMAEKISKGSKVIFWNREPIVKRRADLDFTVLFTVLFGYFWLSEGVFMCVCAGGGGGGGGGGPQYFCYFWLREGVCGGGREDNNRMMMKMRIGNNTEA